MGTLRSNRKHNPKDVIAQKLKKLESICGYTEDNICVVKQKDKHGGSYVKAFPCYHCGKKKHGKTN